jgi:nitrogen PTS system EIIA component
MSAMEIELRDAARMLGLAESIVQSWARRGWLPSVRTGNHVRFNQADLETWAAHNYHRPSAELLGRTVVSENLSMYAALVRGGVHYELAGTTRDLVLGAAAELAQVPGGVDRGRFRDMLIEREQLASTGVGRGIAIPHPRNPLVVHVDDPVVSLCFLQQPVDFNAIDGLPVRVLFTVLSPSTRIHLRLLARLAWLLRDPRLSELLDNQAPENLILDRVLYLEGQITGPRRNGC